MYQYGLPVFLGALIFCGVCWGASVTVWSTNEHIFTDRDGVQTFSIVRTEKGFEPPEVYLYTGDSVRFSSSAKKPFWPASDLHPGHWLYAAFDPKRALAPDEVWEFSFDRVGDWRFHDHLESTAGGIIHVQGSTTTRFRGPCADVAQKTCWNAILTRALEKYGVNAGLVALERLHRGSPLFALECHEYAHDLGLQAFRLYDKKVPLHVRTALCNGGFFHGYMEGFFSRYPDPHDAEAFCLRVGRELKRVFPDAEGQCRHGIGHGAAEFTIPLEPKTWDDLATLAEAPLAVCNESNHDDAMRMRCASGVFSVLKSWALARAKEDAARVSSKELFAVCAARIVQTEKDACYWEFAKKLARAKPVEQPEDQVVLKDFIAAQDYETHAGMVLRSWATIVGRGGVALRTPESLVSFCRMFPPEFSPGCVQGLAEGTLFAQGPSEGVTPTFALCSTPVLDDKERAACYEALQSGVKDTTLSAEAERICDRIPAAYRATVCTR